MNGIFVAEKNISKLPENKSVMIKIASGNDVDWKEYSCAFSEDYDGNILFNEPLKILEKSFISGKISQKKLLKCYAEYELTNDIVKSLSRIIDMFDNAPNDVKRVFL